MRGQQVPPLKSLFPCMTFVQEKAGAKVAQESLQLFGPPFKSSKITSFFEQYRFNSF